MTTLLSSPANMRMERLRRARSLNDVLAISKEVSKDITRASNINKVLMPSTSLSATSIKFNRDSMEVAKPGAVRPKKISVSPKAQAPSTMGQTLTAFKAPPLTQVLRHSAVVHSLQENLHELEAAAAMIRTTFNLAKNKAPALKSITALVKEARETLDSAYASLSFIAKKHLPKEMAALGEECRTFLIDNLDRINYTNLTTQVYVTVGTEASAGKLPHQEFSAKTSVAAPKIRRKETGVITKEELKRDILFAFYIDIEDLRDTSGAVLSHYYVILTGVIGLSGHIRYFLTGLPDFRPPGTYFPGVEVSTSEDMLRRLGLLLSTNDITSTLERKPMPLDTRDVAARGFNNITNVEQTYVSDDSLWVVVNPKLKGAALDNAVDAVVNQVFPLLNAAVGNARRTKSAIKYKTVIRKNKTIIQFFLVPNAKKSGDDAPQINADQLLDLKESLGIPDHVMGDIKKVLKRHF